MNTNKIALLFFFAFLISFQINAQRNYDIYWVSFKDKKDSPYSVFHPQEYLSARAIERRQRFNIPIDESDLPINPSYLEPIITKGFKIHNVSKWLNGVAIITESSSTSPKDLLAFEFVKEVFPIGFKRDAKPAPAEIGEREYNQNYKTKNSYYGVGKNQIQMLNGDYLHKMGFEGQDMHVAILDAGYEYFRETPAFDSLINSGRLLGTHDFVEGDDYVFESSSHGRDVLSCMAANLPYLFVGTAPQASYYLFKTEDMLGEYVIEEYNWVSAAERSDELGVDIINSSLGYYTFDDKKMDYAYVDINGKTSAMSQAATFAAKKGILVVISAGNEGYKDWKHITVPGDADSVLTVGAVDRDGYIARFSSLGFEDRDLIKPDVVARGVISVVAAPKRYDTSYNSGTSFSSPIMAGMVTAFWQALPEYSNMEIIRQLQNHASQKEAPNNSLGYGIPDFFAAYKNFRPSVIELESSKTYYSYLAKLNKHLDIFVSKMDISEMNISLSNTQGQVLFKKSATFNITIEKELQHQSIPNWESLPNGVYFLTVQLDGSSKRILLTK